LPLLSLLDQIYLLNRSFYVNIENSKSSVFQLLYGVLQESVLGPLVFILYTTHLSTVISNSAANHHLYADDTQLLISFSALDYSHNITHLENTLANVSNWMSANFLPLNPSKTEFLIFGLSQKLSKLNNLNNITHLENTISSVSNWMSSNFLSLNPSKTEFLIFCLPQQLSKLNKPNWFISCIVVFIHLY